MAPSQIRTRPDPPNSHGFESFDGPALKIVLEGMNDARLTGLYRLAKKEGGGVRPYFRDPRAMIVLREEMQRRGFLHVLDLKVPSPGKRAKGRPK